MAPCKSRISFPRTSRRPCRSLNPTPSLRHDARARSHLWLGAPGHRKRAPPPPRRPSPIRAPGSRPADDAAHDIRPLRARRRVRRPHLPRVALPLRGQSFRAVILTTICPNKRLKTDKYAVDLWATENSRKQSQRSMPRHVHRVHPGPPPGMPLATPHRPVERFLDPSELAQSISFGGVGATCNPTIAYTCINQRRDVWPPRIAELAKEMPDATESEIAGRSCASSPWRSPSSLSPFSRPRTAGNGRLSMQTDLRFARSAKALADQAEEFHNPARTSS